MRIANDAPQEVYPRLDQLCLPGDARTMVKRFIQTVILYFRSGFVGLGAN